MTSEIRANTLKNRVGLGTVSFTNTGPVVSGIVTATSFSGTGDLDVDGHTNLDNLSIAGVTTTTGSVNVGDDLTIGGEFGMQGSSDNNKYFDARVGSSYKLIFRSSSGGAGNLVTMLQLGTTGSSLVGNLTLGDSSDSSSAAGPEFTLNRNSSSPANADYLGQIKFAGRSSTGIQRNYAKITGKILDVTNGSEDGILEFSHIKNGSQAITGRWRSDSLQLLNGTSLTVAGTTTLSDDLNVDSGTLFVDVSSNRIGINQASPSKALDVVGSGEFSSALTVGATLTVSGTCTLGQTVSINGTNPQLQFVDTNHDSDYSIYGSNGRFSVYDATNSAERFRINSTGKITHTYDGTAYDAQYGQFEIAKDGASNADPDWSYLSFHRSGQIGWQQGIDSNHFVIATTGGGAKNTLDAEKLRITSGGQILLGGTTSPNTFNGVGGVSNLVVAGSTADTDITDNSGASLTISNTDSTANNTAGLHFAREDTDGAPHYSGASVVAQFKETMNTGHYPKADLAFLTSTANNNAPSEKMRLSADGNLSINTTANVQKLRVYDSRGATGYKTALFESNDTANGTRIVIANTGSTSGRGLGINVGGQSYGPGQDRASFGWYNPDNTYSYLNALTLTADGVMAHGQFANFAYSSLPAFFNIINGARVNTGGANQYAAPKGGFSDNARYELEASLISYSTSAQQTIQAINGAQLKIGNSRSNWSYYNNLPNYLLGHAATDCINTSNYTLTLKATMTVFLQRSHSWNAVPLSGWELLEADTNIYPGSTSSRLYVKTLAAGSYSNWDSDSAMYFFVL